eukprot:730691_1
MAQRYKVGDNILIRIHDQEWIAKILAITQNINDEECSATISYLNESKCYNIDLNLDFITPHIDLNYHTPNRTKKTRKRDYNSMINQVLNDASKLNYQLHDTMIITIHTHAAH